MTLPRDQGNVSAAGVLSVEEVATFDTTEIVNGVLTVTTRVAPDVDRTFVTTDGRLTVVEGVGTVSPSQFFAAGGTGLWLDADDPATLFTTTAETTPADTEGFPVGSWRDKSGGARHYRQATLAFRPTITLSGLNSQPLILLSGTKYLQGIAAALAMLNAKSEVHVFVVGRYDSPATADGVFALTRNGSTSQARVSMQVDANLKANAATRNLDSGSATVALGAAVVSGDYFIREAKFEVADGLVYHLLDGLLEDVATLAPASFPATDSGAGYVGATATTAVMQGAIAEIIAYVGPVSDAVRSGAYKHLREHWGLTHETPELVEPAAHGAWTWFNGPRVTKIASGHYAVGALKKEGSVAVTDWQGGVRDEAVLAATFELDDHDNPAVIRLQSGYLLAAYSKHNDAAYYVQKSTNVDDASAWGSATDIDSQLGHSNYSYANLIQLASGRIYLFFRATNAVSTAGGWHYSYSDDDGDTWATGVQLCATFWAYHKMIQNGDNRIDFAINNSHPNQADTSTYHMYMLDTEGTITFHETDGTEITSLPFDSTDWTEVYNHAVDGRSWIWDIVPDEDGNPVISFATYPGSTTSDAPDHSFYQARWSGSAWSYAEVCEGGAPIYTVEDFYVGGIVSDPENVDVVYTSRAVDAAGDLSTSGVHQLFRYVSTDDGATWSGTQLTFGASKRVRPFIPTGARDLFYLLGRYDAYTNFDMVVERLSI